MHNGSKIGPEKRGFNFFNHNVIYSIAFTKIQKQAQILKAERESNIERAEGLKESQLLEAQVSKSYN